MKKLTFLALILAAGTASAGLQYVPSTGPHDPTVGMMDVGSRVQPDGMGGYRIYENGRTTWCRTDYMGGYRCN